MTALRILLIAPQPFYIERGTPIAVRHLAEALCDMGHAVDLLATHLGEDVTYPGLTIHRAKAGAVKSLPIGFSFAKLVVDGAIGARMLTMLRAKQYDVIHAVEEAVFLALAAKPFSKAKLVYDMDSVLSDQLVEKFPRAKWLSRTFQAFEKRAVRGADLVLPVCEAIAQRARQWTHGPVDVLPDIAPEAPEDGRGDVPSIRQAGSDKPLALYVGNLDHYQGIDLLLEAVALMAPETRPDLAIIGGSDDAIAHYSDKSEKLDITQDVRFLGPRPLSDLMHYLAQADILCSPRTKGVNTPMKVYAYMASGRPIVATDILSHTQVLDAESAFLAAATPEKYADALEKSVQNPSLRSEIGARAAKLATQSYGIARYRERLSAAYSKLNGSEAAHGTHTPQSHN